MAYQELLVKYQNSTLDTLSCSFTLVAPLNGFRISRRLLGVGVFGVPKRLSASLVESRRGVSCIDASPIVPDCRQIQPIKWSPFKSNCNCNQSIMYILLFHAYTRITVMEYKMIAYVSFQWNILLIASEVADYKLALMSGLCCGMMKASALYVKCNRFNNSKFLSMHW